MPDRVLILHRGGRPGDCPTILWMKLREKPRCGTIFSMLRSDSYSAIRLVVPTATAQAQALALCRGLEADGRTIWINRGFAPPAASDNEVVVVMGYNMIDPRLVRELMSADIPHLPLVFSGDRAWVGPGVIPGVSACVSCLNLARAETEIGWARQAVQQFDQVPKNWDPVLACNAGMVAVQLIQAEVSGISVTLTADSWSRLEQKHRPHPGCCCQSPAGNVTAIDLGRSQPTTTAAFAQPA